jgi:hypothetical protein
MIGHIHASLSFFRTIITDRSDLQWTDVMARPQQAGGIMNNHSADFLVESRIPTFSLCRSINPQQTILSSKFPHSYANRALNGDIIVLSFSIHSSFRFSMSGFPACLLCGYLCRFSLRYIFITAMSFIAFSVQDLYPLRAALDHVMIVTIKIPIYAYWRLIRTVP